MHYIWESIWRKVFQLLGDFCKSLPTQNTIFQTFQNHWNMQIMHFSVCQYDKYHSKKLCSTIYVYGSYNLSVWEVPWNYDISNPYYRGDITHQMGVWIWTKLSHLLGWLLQNHSHQKIGQLKPSKIVKIWTFHMYLCMFMEVIVCKPDMSPETLMTYHMHTIWWTSNQITWEKTMQKSKFQISHVVSHSQKYIYNMLLYQYRYETSNGNMSVYNEFFGTCHFSISEWLEYILGEMTWNNMWGPFL